MPFWDLPCPRLPLDASSCPLDPQLLPCATLETRHKISGHLALWSSHHRSLADPTCCNFGAEFPIVHGQAFFRRPALVNSFQPGYRFATRVARRSRLCVSKDPEEHVFARLGRYPSTPPASAPSCFLPPASLLLHTPLHHHTSISIAARSPRSAMDPRSAAAFVPPSRLSSR